MKRIKRFMYFRKIGISNPWKASGDKYFYSGFNNFR